MSNVPYYLPKARSGYGYGHSQIIDGLLKDGLTDAFDNQHMGVCAEFCAQQYNITRQQQDQYAIESYRKAALATQKGLFRSEIVPISVSGKGGIKTMVSEDEGIKKLNVEKMASLKSAFKENGSVTAANASSLNDGAAALVLASGQVVSRLGLAPVARILGFADAEKAPVDFTTAPALAIPKALRNASVSASSVDYYEINEAFSVVALVNSQLLNLDLDRVNVNGGAVAIGHPIGASGARILVTLINVLKARNATIGVAAICNGGGGATAVVIERL